MKTIKKLLIFFLFFAIHSVMTYSQTIQKGRVLEKDSNGKPLENAEILAKDALPANSDNDGKYQLIFKEKSPGEMIFVDSINKKGYELVNESQVQNWKLSNVKEFNIILCKEGLLKESREFFYGIGRSHYEDEYRQKRSEIDALKQANQIAEKEYNQRLKEIYDERQKAYDQLDYYSDLLSRINTDDLSEIERKAYNFSKEGKLDEAIQVYENEKLLTKFIKNDSLKQQVNADLESMVPSVNRYAELCAFAGGKENYEKADKCYEAIALSDTTNFNYILDFTSFLARQNHILKCQKWCIILLSSAKDDYEKCMANIFLGIVSVSTFQFERASYFFSEATSNIKKNGKNDPQSQKLILSLTSILQQIMIINSDIDENYHNKAIDIFREESKDNPTIFNPILAFTLRVFAQFQESKAQYEKSQSNFTEALIIYRELSKFSPQLYNIEIVRTLNGLASMQMQLNQYTKAKSNLGEALGILENLAKSNPKTYDVDIANTYVYFALLHGCLRQYSEAEVSYYKALMIYKELVKQNHLTYDPVLANTFMGIARVQEEIYKYDEAETNIFEALNIFELLKKVNPFYFFHSCLAEAKIELANIQKAKKTIHKGRT